MKSNPTSLIDLDFEKYGKRRQWEKNVHLIDGIPDYSFSLDQKLLHQLNSMPPMRAFAKAFTSWMGPYYRKLETVRCIAVGPNQYPEIYTLGEECAGRLGISVPKIFIKYDVTMNAYTYSIDEGSPTIVLHSALVENLNTQELKAIIGHECGHIHNLHGIYHNAGALLTQIGLEGSMFLFPGLAQVIGLLSGGAKLALNRWIRCGEVSCDRAGMICVDNPYDAVSAFAKLRLGGNDKLKNINVQEYIKQIEEIQGTPVRLIELAYDHPITPKRLAALNLFQKCDVYYSWFPEKRDEAIETYSKEEIDRRCEEFISVTARKKNSKGRGMNL